MGEGRRNSWFVCLPIHTVNVTPVYLASTSPRKRKGAGTPRQGPPPGELPASPLRTRTTNVRHANQLQPAPAGPARAGRAPQAAAPHPRAPASRSPARQPPPPDLRAPSPRSGLPPPPSRGLTCCPPPCRAKPRVNPKPSRREAGAGGAGGGAAPRLTIPASRDLPGPPAAAPQGPLGAEAPPPACSRSLNALGSWALRAAGASLGSQVSIFPAGREDDVLTSRPAPARWGGRNVLRLAPALLLQIS